MNSYKSGHFAELIAKWYMRLHGYKIISNNFITGRGTLAGEIDFIAKKDKLIVFVEVKKRDSIYNALYAISENQKKRIVRGAQSFIKQNSQYMSYDMRFDAILICFPLHIYHVENAWNCNL